VPPDPTAWPWPLDGVQAWFEDLWNNVLSAPFNAIQELWNWIWEKLLWLKERVEEVADWIWQKIEPLLGPVADWVEVAATWAWDTLWSFLEDPVGTLLDLGNYVYELVYEKLLWLKERISEGWDWIVSQVQSAVNLLAQRIPHLIAQLTHHLAERFTAGIDWLRGVVTAGLDSLWSAVSSGFNNVSTWITTSVGGLWESLVGLAGDLLRGMAESLGEALTGVWDWLLRHLSWIAEMVMGAVQIGIARLKDVVWPLFRQFMDSVTAAMTPGSAPEEISQAATVMVEAIWQNQISLIDQMYRSSPDPEEITAVAEAILGAAVTAAITAMGMATIADLVHPFKDINFKVTAREIIYWSGIPSATAAIAVLPTAIGLLDPLRYELHYRWPVIIPGPADLIRFVVREIFIPEEFERLKHPLPGPEYFEYMQRHGYNRFWAEAFWAAHWVRPTIEQLNAMLWRRIEIEGGKRFDYETWEREVRLNDYVPYAIPWLEQIIYRPYTRVDARRMWDARTITEEELYENYRWLGYDDEHARGMVVWTKVWTALPELINRYRYGWISLEDVYNELVGYGMPEERVRELIEARVRKEEPGRVAKERELTKADILALLRYGEITDMQAREMLIDLGYDEVEADFLIALTREKYADEIKELTTTQILKLYRYEIEDRESVKRRLVEAGWSLNAAEALLRLEDVKLKDAQVERMRERDLTPTQVIRLVVDKVIPERTGQSYLRFLGFSDWEIKVRYILAGIWPTPMEMRDLVEREVVTLEHAREYIMDLGWTAKEADEILGVAG